MTLPTEAQARKTVPIYSGVIRYFPDALAAVAELSKIGNDQHNPGQPLHWDRSKSTDELDALTRHLVEAGKMDTDGVRHSAKIAWRALANLQKELERERAPKEVVPRPLEQSELHQVWQQERDRELIAKSTRWLGQTAIPAGPVR